MLIEKLSQWRWRIGVGLGLALVYALILPDPLFQSPHATIVRSSKGALLGGVIAADGQWRFPESDSVPPKFATCLRLFEDEYFAWHPGFNPVATVRAAWQNLRAGRIVSGGSTITMQTIRLARQQDRTFLEKIWEMVLATRLELSHSKAEIMALYASHAPFGGNTVGLDAAAWRYYGRNADQLSWGEAALLAVLPNQPGLIFPGRNQDLLEKKRNRLLEKLLRRGIIDSMTCELAKSEPLPGAPNPLPALAPHLLERIKKEGLEGERVTSSIDADLQINVSHIARRFAERYQGNEIHNMAIVVAKVQTGEVLAYLGNTENQTGVDHGNDVDVVTAPRSTGSILKPFLYAAMLDEGLMLPNTLYSDIPTFINGFAPKNFYETYDGAVKAKDALARSLNIPAVRMLQHYTVPKFHEKLRQLGLGTISRPPDYYGLSLILGGAEGSLWDLVGVYASMARTLKNYHTNAPQHYSSGDFRPLRYLPAQVSAEPTVGDAQFSVLGAGAIWFTFESMLEVYRPGAGANWELYETGKKIAWKTGTSFGHRDAWAIGLTPDYVVGVWVGNANGEGRPDLTGFQVAAPILFNVFDLLPTGQWFTPPYDDLVMAKVCKHSGHLASSLCQAEEVYIPRIGLRTSQCPYEKVVNLDRSGQFRVHSDCEQVANMRQETYFVLPPVEEWYFRPRNAFYRSLPPFRPDCISSEMGAAPPMQVIYPLPNARILVPRELDGTLGQVVLEVAHRRPSATIFWHLDEQFLGETRRTHRLSVQPTPGRHTLTLIDEEGGMVRQSFEIVRKD